MSLPNVRCSKTIRSLSSLSALAELKKNPVIRSTSLIDKRELIVQKANIIAGCSELGADFLSPKRIRQRRSRLRVLEDQCNKYMHKLKIVRGEIHHLQRTIPVENAVEELDTEINVSLLLS